MRKKTAILFFTAFLIYMSTMCFLYSCKMQKEPEVKGARADNLSSGPVTEVPWQDDEQFKSTIEKNGTKVLLAAYRTVLKDPLPGEEYNVHLGAKMMAGTVLKSGEIFSQNNSIGPYTENRGYREGPTYSGANLIKTIGGGVCKIASTLYNVSIMSNLEIVERRNHSMPVPYVPYGQDATVSYGNVDFRFKNSTKDPLLIWAQGVDNTLYIAFYGKEIPPKVEWHHDILDIQKAQEIYKKNESLPKGTRKVILEGMDGVTVKSWVTIEKSDGTIETKQLGTSYYKPMASIIEVGE